MKIKLTDGTIYEVQDLSIKEGVMNIQFIDKTAEEVMSILNDSSKLGKIILLEDNTDEDLAYYLNYSQFVGVTLTQDSITGMLSQIKDDIEVRISAIEATANEALSIAQSLKSDDSTAGK